MSSVRTAGRVGFSLLVFGLLMEVAMGEIV